MYCNAMHSNAVFTAIQSSATSYLSILAGYFIDQENHAPFTAKEFLCFFHDVMHTFIQIRLFFKDTFRQLK